MPLIALARLDLFICAVNYNSIILSQNEKQYVVFDPCFLVLLSQLSLAAPVLLQGLIKHAFVSNNI